MECHVLLSILNTVLSITGASSQGMLPIYEDRPMGDLQLLWDELPTIATLCNKKLSASDLRVARMLASWMTKGEINYVFNSKGEDNKMHAETKRMTAPTSFCGAQNDGNSGNQTESRMLSLYLHPNVGGPRNAQNAMNNPNTSSRRDAGERAAFELAMKKHQALSMTTCKGVEGGGMPPPNFDQFDVYLETALEYLQDNYPDQADKIRMFDIGHTIAAVLGTWTGITLAYDKWLAPLDAAGRAIDLPSLAIPFDITKLRDHVIRYMRVDEDVCMFVVGFVVYYSSQPEANIVLRWIAETLGNYPYVSGLKRQIKKMDRERRAAEAEKGAERLETDQAQDGVSHDSENEADQQDCDDEAAETAAQQPDVQVDDAGVAAAAQDADQAAQDADQQDADADAMDQFAVAARGDYAAVKQDLADLHHYAVLNASLFGDAVFAKKTKKGRSGRATGSGRAGGGGLQPGEPAPSAEEIELQLYHDLEGPSINLPLEGQAGRKNQNIALARTYLRGLKKPENRYKEESVVVDSTGKEKLLVNPNYILVEGDLETFAMAFWRLNRAIKMTPEQVLGLLQGLKGAGMLANLLPLVPKERSDLLLDIEMHRARLWEDRDICKKRRCPIMMGGPRGVYILVEALLDSPYHIVTKTLRHLCNETTIKRLVPLPIPDKNCPEVLKVFDAYPVPGKKLRCANPAFLGAEAAALPRDVRELQAVSDTAANQMSLEWGKGSEVQSIRRFFRENGVPGNPADYTYESLYKSRILARQELEVREGKHLYKNYPKDFIDTVNAYDQAAKKERGGGGSEEAAKRAAPADANQQDVADSRS
jgi:hypothetical protein